MRVQYALCTFLALTLITGCNTRINTSIPFPSEIAVTFRSSIEPGDEDDTLRAWLEFASPIDQKLLVLEQRTGNLNTVDHRQFQEQEPGIIAALNSYYPGNYNDIVVTRRDDALMVWKRHSGESEDGCNEPWENIASFTVPAATKIELRDLPEMTDGDLACDDMASFPASR